MNLLFLSDLLVYFLDLCQLLFPSRVGSEILRALAVVRFDDSQFLQGGEGLVMVFVDTTTHTSTLGSTHTTVGLVQLDRSTAHTSQGITEDLAEEHVGFSCMDLANIHTHLLHDLHTVAEAEHDTLLCSPHEMSLGVLVEVHAMDRASHLTVLKNTLSTIAERDDRHALATDGDISHHIVHLSIGDSLWSHITTDSGIEDTRTIDAEQHAQTVEIGGVVHMCEGVHTTLLVVVSLAQHTIYHT